MTSTNLNPSTWSWPIRKPTAMTYSRCLTTSVRKEFRAKHVKECLCIGSFLLLLVIANKLVAAAATPVYCKRHGKCKRSDSYKQHRVQENLTLDSTEKGNSVCDTHHSTQSDLNAIHPRSYFNAPENQHIYPP